MTSKYATKLLPRAHAGSAEPSFGDRLAVLAFGAVGWPWLLRSLSGGRKRDKVRLLSRLGLPADALPNLGSW